MNDQSTETIYQNNEIKENNSIPVSLVKIYIEDNKELNKQNSDMRVFLAKNGINYPPADN